MGWGRWSDIDGEEPAIGRYGGGTSGEIKKPNMKIVKGLTSSGMRDDEKTYATSEVRIRTQDWEVKLQMRRWKDKCRGWITGFERRIARTKAKERYRFRMWENGGLFSYCGGGGFCFIEVDVAAQTKVVWIRMECVLYFSV